MINRNEIKLREAAYALLGTDNPNAELFAALKHAGDVLGVPVTLGPGNGFRHVLVNGKHVGGITT